MPALTNTRQAFVTLVTNSEYGLGAAVLGHQLRNLGTSRTTVAMVTSSVTRETRDLLSRTWDNVIDVTELESKDAVRLALMKRPELGVTFSKLNVWKLTHLEKVVFVDADTMPIANIDDLFEYEELSACRDAGWPDCFNTGLFVLTPSQDTYDALYRRACDEGSFDGGDQGVLNAHFSSWSHGDISRHIPFSYNVNPNASYTYLPAYNHFADKVKMVHFLGAVKPWHYQYTATGQVQGRNLTEHTRRFLEQWHEIAEKVKSGDSGNSGKGQHTGQQQQQQQPVQGPVSAPYVPPVTPHSADHFTSRQSTEEGGAPDVQSVLSHVTAQIKEKDQARLVTKY